MAITRINNNQITDSSPGNIYLGVNAAVKVQDYSITAGKIQNNLNYGSDLTITGNLTVQGNTTAIDTVNLVVEDPLILLAKEQTGAPALDIGFIGKRGTEDNIAFVWDESADQFVAVFTTSEVTNSVININSYASLQVLNLTTANANITGNVTFSGNIVGNVTVTGNIAANNFNATSAVTAGTTITATGNVTGGNLTTGGVVQATGNVTGGNVTTAGIVSATGNVVGGNLTTAGVVAATGNVSGGNLTTGGVVTATGNVSGGNITTAGRVDATGNVAGGNITTAGVVTATGNVSGGNLTTAGVVAATGNVSGGNITTAGLVSAATVTATGNVSGGNLTTAGVVAATGNVSGGNLTTAGVVAATGNVSGGNITTGGVVSATGNVSGGNITTGGVVSATGNVSGGNLITAGDMQSNTIQTTGNATIGGNLIVQGNITYINIDDLRVEDPVIIMGTGANGAPPVADDGQDRGIFMEYYSTDWSNAFVGWDRSINSIFAATSVNFSANNVVNVLEYGPFTAGNANLQSANVSGNVAGGNLTTVGLVSATGNLSGGNVTTAGVVSATGNVSGGNLTTAGVVAATGNVSGGNITTAGVVSATGNVTGGNLITAGVVAATGNITGGNISAGSGVISTTGNINGGNINATANVTGAGAVFTGNVTADTFIGNIQGNIDAGGANTNIQFNDNDVLAGSAAFTFDKTSNAVTASGNISAGNLLTGGVVSATGNVSGGNITTANVVQATGNVIGGNLTTAGVVSATGNVSGGNITTANVVQATGNVIGGNIVTTGTADLGNIRITGNDVTNFASNIITINAAGSDIDLRVSGDTVANLLRTDAGTDTVLVGGGNATVNAAFKVDTTNSMMPPVGNTAQRPSTPVVGMIRFSTSNDSLEQYASTGWETVGATFTVIVADAFVGNGVQTVFTLSEDSTTAATIVAINGIVQEPTTAYAVSGNTLTFTEAPAVSDAIDARILTTTTTVTEIQNTSGNAIVSALDTADTIQITGNLLPATSNTFNLGSGALRWNELFLEGSTITLGNVVIKNTSGNTIGFFGPDGTTPGAIDTNNIDSAGISNGTSSVQVITSGGNIRANVGGSTVQLLSSGGANVTGFVTATGNITGGNLITAGLVSVTGNITGGNLSVGTGIVSVGSIVNNNANGVGNIGTSALQFNTIFAKATSAQYADLAEMYEADAGYEPGTVLCFGGTREVTLCNQSDCTRVAGVVSTNPSYLMNSGQTGEHVAAVALTGRVPCRVSGTIRKGDLIVSTGDGRGRANNAAAVGTVIGKALADFEGTDGVIEVVVGRV